MKTCHTDYMRNTNKSSATNPNSIFFNNPVALEVHNLKTRIGVACNAADAGWDRITHLAVVASNPDLANYGAVLVEAAEEVAMTFMVSVDSVLRAVFDDYEYY